MGAEEGLRIARTVPRVVGRLFPITVALGLAGCWSGPAVTTPVADLTADVFVLELSLPEGISVADAEAGERREAAELELKVTETKIALGLVEETRWLRNTVTLTEEGFQALGRKGSHVAAGTQVRRSTSRGTGPGGQPVEVHSYTVTVESPGGRYEVAGRPRAEAEAYWRPALQAQRAALAGLPPVAVSPTGRLEVRERWRYVTVSPPVAQLEEGGLHTNTRSGPCSACMLEAEKRHALYLRSFGTAGVDPATLSSGALETGLEIRANEFVFGSASEPDSTRVRRPSTGRLVLRREASCRGHLVRVDQTLVVDKGSDVIAVPRREAQTWHELRDAACASNASTVHEVLGVPSPRQPNVGSNAALFWIEQHRAELARLERGELKQQIP